MSERKYIAKRRLRDIRRASPLALTLHGIPKGAEVTGFAEAWTNKYGHCIIVEWRKNLFYVREEDLEPAKTR